MENIDKYDVQNKLFLEEDFNNEGEVYSYIKELLDEEEETDLLNMLTSVDNETPIELQLLKTLQLIRVGLYPDGTYDTAYYAVFDYSFIIEGEFCNQLLAVKTNENGDLVSIDWES